MKRDIKLSPPWVLFFREVEAMFKDDPDIKIEFDESTPEIKLYVTGEEKAEALAELLPSEKAFGNVVLKLSVIPANTLTTNDPSLFQKAFEGNPAFKYVQTIDGIFSVPISYVVFDKKVVQYFADDLSDLHGVKSTLYQEIAKDIFGSRNNIYFCTDVEEE